MANIIISSPLKGSRGRRKDPRGELELAPVLPDLEASIQIQQCFHLAHSLA